jgi:hypothetical protein
MAAGCLPQLNGYRLKLPLKSLLSQMQAAKLSRRNPCPALKCLGEIGGFSIAQLKGNINKLHLAVLEQFHDSLESDLINQIGVAQIALFQSFGYSGLTWDIGMKC